MDITTAEKSEIEILKAKLKPKGKDFIIDHIKNEIPIEDEIISDKPGINSFKIVDKREHDFEVTILLICACNHTSWHTLLINNVHEEPEIRCRCTTLFRLGNKLKTLKVRMSGLPKDRILQKQPVDYLIRDSKTKIRIPINWGKIKRKISVHNELLKKFHNLFVMFSKKNYHEISNSSTLISSTYKEFLNKYGELKWLERFKELEFNVKRILKMKSVKFKKKPEKNLSKNILTASSNIKIRKLKILVKKELHEGLKELLASEFFKAKSKFVKAKRRLQHRVYSEDDEYINSIRERIEVTQKMITLLFEGKILATYNKIESYSVKRKFNLAIKEYDRLLNEIKQHTLINDLKDTVLVLLEKEMRKTRRDQYDNCIEMGTTNLDNNQFRRAKAMFMRARTLTPKVCHPNYRFQTIKNLMQNIDYCKSGIIKQKIQKWIPITKKIVEEGRTSQARIIISKLKADYERIPIVYGDINLKRRINELNDIVEIFPQTKLD